ncbi:MAG: transcription termination/antitermination protein NusG [Thermoanaerobaculia bacterium]
MRTKGGEALPVADVSQGGQVGWESGGHAAEGLERPQWHVLWTRSNCEQLVFNQLTTKGFHLFLPRVDRWSRQSGVRYLSRVPLFPGYLFLHHAIDKASYIEVCKPTGLVSVLGERWDRLAVVPDAEIEAIRRVLDAKLPALAHPYLREGQRVRITHGPLVDVEGILVRGKPNRGLLIVSVDMLRRSVAVEVDCTWVEGA